MTYQKPVLKSKLHSANRVLSSADQAQLEGRIADTKRSEVEQKQEEIDEYNYNTCSQIDPIFSTIQLSGKQIIVRLHKENYIKGVQMVGDAKIPIYDAWISQVDGRMRQTDPPRWVDNPLPYVFMGTVVAMSPLVAADYLAEKELLAKLDPIAAANFKVLEVGDVVHLNHFMFADHRFYINKQMRDFIKNPNEYRIEHWEGYVRIHPTVIEAIALDKNELFSPYAEYKRLLNDPSFNG